MTISFRKKTNCTNIKGCSTDEIVPRKTSQTMALLADKAADSGPPVINGLVGEDVTGRIKVMSPSSVLMNTTTSAGRAKRNNKHQKLLPATTKTTKTSEFHDDGSCSNNSSSDMQWPAMTTELSPLACSSTTTTSGAIAPSSGNGGVMQNMQSGRRQQQLQRLEHDEPADGTGRLGGSHNPNTASAWHNSSSSYDHQPSNFYNSSGAMNSNNDAWSTHPQNAQNAPSHHHQPHHQSYNNSGHVSPAGVGRSSRSHNYSDNDSGLTTDSSPTASFAGDSEPLLYAAISSASLLKQPPSQHGSSHQQATQPSLLTSSTSAELLLPPVSHENYDNLNNGLGSTSSSAKYHQHNNHHHHHHPQTSSLASSTSSSPTSSSASGSPKCNCCSNLIARCCFGLPHLKAINVRRCVLALFAITVVTIFYYTHYMDSGVFVG